MKNEKPNFKKLENTISQLQKEIFELKSKHESTVEYFFLGTSILNKILDISPIGISYVDTYGNVLYSNKRAVEIFRLPRNKLLKIEAKSAAWHAKTLDGKPYPDEELPFTQVKNTKKPVFNIEHAIEYEGEKKIITVSAAPLLNNTNDFLGMVSIVDDITSLKLADEIIHKSKSELEEYFENDISADYVVSPEGEIINCNKTFIELFGFKDKSQAINSNITDLYSNTDDRKELISILKEKGKVESFEVTFNSIDGKTINTIINSIGKFSESGVLLSSRGYIVDITKLKKVEEELILAKEKAEESNRLKSAFLANMSHEIRTPMNGILGFAELLKEPSLSGEKQQDYIKIIEKSGARMLNIINNIVNISKIESSIMDIHLSETNVNKQVEFVYQTSKLDAERKNLSLSFSNALPDKEAVIKTDREKLYAILTNLVNNAIKYTDKGSIVFGYNIKENYIEFYVKDTGIGIPIERQEAIFERFIQADIEDKMARQGAGLGLAISRAYVEMLGGKIWVESEPNIGSTFYFTIPYNSKPRVTPIEQNISPSQEDKSQLKQFKVLIVEDDETSEVLLKEMVSKLSKVVLTAKNGLEAVNLCRQNPDIDLILMDIQMPDMNGYKATQQIRKFNQEVIIIAQTAFALLGDKKHSIDAGCNDYISKPVSREKLTEIILKHLKNK